jgi:hypothetical protein
MRGAVEVSVRALNQRRVWPVSIQAVTLRVLGFAKGVQRGQRASHGDFENRALAVRSATSLRCPVEVPLLACTSVASGVAPSGQLVSRLNKSRRDQRRRRWE